jgi:pimeloyl-ACP methyl ester carboxylesterase
MLADAGYDVWLANFRGNKYSKNHLSLEVMTAEFWDFGWEEHALYDIPAFTSFILGKTGYKKLAYISHSMGTTAAFFAISLNNTFYQDKWSLVVAMAPPLSLSSISSPLFNILAHKANYYFISLILNYFHIYEIFPANWLNQGFFKYACSYVPQYCRLGNYLLADYDPGQNDDTATKVYFAHFPSGSSVKQVGHFA